MSKDKLVVNDAVLALSAVVTTSLAMDSKTGATTVADGIYDSNLPEGITPEVVKVVSDYNRTFIAGVTHAFGTAANAAMTKNKSLEQATVSVPMGHKDVLHVTADRSKTFINRLGDGSEITKYGVIKAEYDVHAGKASGQLKTVRQLLGEAALAAFGK